MLAGIVVTCCASEEAFARGIPGSYRRAVTGMYSEVLTLSRDGSYVFKFHFDVGADEEKGAWTVRDSRVVLTPKKRGEMIKRLPSQFQILTLDGDLALSAIESETEAQPEDSVMRLFKPEKRKANSGRSAAP